MSALALVPWGIPPEVAAQDVGFVEIRQLPSSALGPAQVFVDGALWREALDDGLVDLLTDCGHLASEHGYDFVHLVERALKCWSEEQRDPEGLDEATPFPPPPAWTSICASSTNFMHEPAQNTVCVQNVKDGKRKTKKPYRLDRASWEDRAKSQAGRTLTIFFFSGPLKPNATLPSIFANKV